MFENFTEFCIHLLYMINQPLNCSINIENTKARVYAIIYMIKYEIMVRIIIELSEFQKTSNRQPDKISKHIIILP